MADNGRLLIIGAGAGGVVTGYYAAKGGADVSFFVRPARQEKLKPPLALYCYDDGDLKFLEDYQLVTEVEAIRQNHYQYIIVTLDKTALEAEANTPLLMAIGDSARANSAVVMSCAVGPGIRELVKARTGLPDNQILCGTFNFLSHFVPMPEQAFHPAVDQEKLARAYAGFRNIGDKGGLFVDNANPSVSKQFAEFYNRNGIQTVAILPGFALPLVFNGFFTFYAACELAGWPSGKEFVRDRQFWPLACKSFNEIFKLPEFGMSGRIMAAILRPVLWRSLWLKIEEGAWPLDSTGFNRLHHGGKVVNQDTDILRHHLETGKSLGRPMRNLERLVTLLDEKRKH
jgi:Ketopantoate reductase PanE/ApbA